MTLSLPRFVPVFRYVTSFSAKFFTKVRSGVVSQDTKFQDLVGLEGSVTRTHPLLAPSSTRCLPFALRFR